MDGEARRYVDFMSRVASDRAAGVRIVLTTPEEVAAYERLKAKLEKHRADIRARDAGSREQQRGGTQLAVEPQHQLQPGVSMHALRGLQVGTRADRQGDRISESRARPRAWKRAWVRLLQVPMRALSRGEGGGTKGT